MWSQWRERFAVAFLLLVPLSATVGSSTLNLQWSDLAAFGFLVSSIAITGSRTPVSPQLRWGVVVYLGSMLPSFLNTTHLGSSLLEFGKTAYLIGVGLMLIRWMTHQPSRQRGVQVIALTTAILIGGAPVVWLFTSLTGHLPWGWVSIMEVPNVGQVVRVNATVSSPALLANYLTLGVPVLAAYGAARSRRPRAMCWSLLVAGTLAALTTVSHSVAGVLTAVALLTPHRTRWDRAGRLLVSVLAVGTVVFALLSTTVAIPKVQLVHRTPSGEAAVFPSHAFVRPGTAGDMLTVNISYAWVSYGLLKRIAWEAWRAHPWVGNGLDEFPSAVATAFQEGRIHYPSADPHSTWGGALAETGLIGVLGLAGFWGVLLGGAREAKRRDMLARDQWQIRALHAGLVGLLVNSLHVDIMHFRFLWVGAALFHTARQASRAAP